jgi:hypothetical protein
MRRGKIIPFVVILLLLNVASVWAQTTVSVKNPQLQPGTLTIEVWVENIEGVNYWEFNLNYDPAIFRFQGYRLGDSFPDTDWYSFIDEFPGSIQIGAIGLSADAVFTGSSILARISFEPYYQNPYGQHLFDIGPDIENTLPDGVVFYNVNMEPIPVDNITDGDFLLELVPCFTISPDPGVVGGIITFDASSTLVLGLNITYTWDFGDGSEIVETPDDVITHVYPETGAFTVNLMVKDEFASQQTYQIIKINPEVFATFKASSYEALVDERIIFSADGSKAFRGKIIGYIWDFADGASAKGVTVEHAYTHEGFYNVILTVLTDENKTAQAKKIIHIQAEKDAKDTGCGLIGIEALIVLAIMCLIRLIR